MKSFKGRTVDLSKPVLVYRNLHRGGYSLKQSNKVVAHADELWLLYCDFLVNKSGQKRVRATKQKNAHAFVKGLVVEGTTKYPDNRLTKVSYNPYENDTFMSEGRGVLGADEVILNAKGVFSVKNIGCHQ